MDARKRPREGDEEGWVESPARVKRIGEALERKQRHLGEEEHASSATLAALPDLALSGETAYLSSEWDTHPRRLARPIDISDAGIWPAAAQLGRSLAANSTVKHLALREVGVSQEVSDALLEALKVNRTLSCVSDWQFTYGNHRAPTRSCFAQSLPFNKGLRTLRIVRPAFNGFGLDESAQKLAEDLAEGLSVNETLTSLTLDRCRTIGQEGARALGAALRVNKALSTLRLERVTLNEAEGAVLARAVGEALTVNSTLTTLSLHGNFLGLQGLQLVVAALEVNSTLGSLDLSFNLLSAEACAAFSTALKTNRGLHTVAFSQNSIGPEGARAFAEALLVNRTVTSLSLHACSLQDSGAEHIAGALQEPGSLTSLSLSSNGLTSSGAEALARSLARNRGLARLELWGNKIEIPGLWALAEMMRSNFTLTSLIVTSGTDKEVLEDLQIMIKSFAMKNRGQQLVLQLTVKERLGEVLRLSFQRLSGAVALELELHEMTTLGELQEEMQLSDARVRVQLPHGGLLDQQERALPLAAILSPQET